MVDLVNDLSRAVILHVDDEPAIRYTIGRVLRREGFTVREATTGTEGLEFAREERPDLIILDVNLPDVDGFEVCRRIKADPATAAIPVLHLSASHVSEEEQLVGLEGGADGYLVQPVAPDVLVANVKALLRLRGAEEKYRSIFENAMDGIFQVTAEGHLAAANPALARIFGYDSPEEMETAVSDFRGHLFAAPERFEEFASSVREHGSLSGFEVQGRCKDGSTVWISISARALYDGGDIVGYEGTIEDIAERKRAEECLAYHARLLENVHDGILATDERFIITAWNRGAEEMFGWTADEVMRRNVREVVPTQLAEEQRAEALRAMSETGRYRTEVTTYRKDGTPVHVEGISVALRDEQGQITGYLSIIRDVTERKRAEEDRDRVFTLSPDLLCVAGLDGYFKRVNPAFEETLGYGDRELLARPFIEFIHPEDRAATVEEVEKLATGTPTVYFENRYRRKDGSYAWLAWKAVTVVEEGLIYAAARDVTEQRQAEEVRSRLAAIVESSEDAIIGKTLDGTITDWNSGAQRMYGYSPGEAVGRPISILAPPDRLGEIPKILEKIRRGEAISNYETARVTRDGRRLDVSLAVSPIKDSAGNVVGASTIARDITERKRAEEEIRTRAGQQAIVADLGRRALAETDPSVLMDEAVSRVARTLEVEYCKVLELLPEGDALLVRAGVGWKEGLVGSAKVSADTDSQAGYTLLSDEPVMVEDLREEERFSGPPLLHDHGVVSGMSVVIRGRDRPFGVLGAHTVGRRTFTRDDVNFLQAVANVLAEAIERRRAEEALQEIREAERSRIARDLHDVVLQDLTYALQRLQSPETTSSREDNGHNAEMDEAVEALRRSVGGLRSAVYDLRLESAGDEPFVRSVESLVELNRRMSPRCEIELKVSEGFSEHLPDGQGRELLRILQEALTNARRHSGARHVRISLGADQRGRLWAEVEDDGRGFDPRVAHAGMGMRGMRERARAIKGDLKVESKPGGGTKVRFEGYPEKDRQGSEEKARVFLVEDHASFRQALAAALARESNFEVVGQAGTLAQAREMLYGQEADVAIVDLGLPDGYGGDLIKELRKGNPQAQALVLSASLDKAEIARAIESGAAGVLHKSAGMAEVAEAVRRLRAGETLMPLEEVVELLRYVGSRRNQEHRARRVIAQLTPREKEVLEALAEGLEGREIAERLGISRVTERNHMASILSKLGVHSRLQALVFALRHGVVEIR